MDKELQKLQKSVDQLEDQLIDVQKEQNRLRILLHTRDRQEQAINTQLKGLNKAILYLSPDRPKFEPDPVE